MSLRTGAVATLIAVAALIVAPAPASAAQDPTPTASSTPTATPTPTPTTRPTWAPPARPPVYGIGTCTAEPATIVVGSTSTITCTGIVNDVGYWEAFFTLVDDHWTPDSPGHFVYVGGPVSVGRPIIDGTSSVGFTTPAVGSYTIHTSLVQTDGDSSRLNDVMVTVVAADAELPATGGRFPTVALVVGTGAAGLGLFALTFAAGRRRQRG